MAVISVSNAWVKALLRFVGQYGVQSDSLLKSIGLNGAPLFEEGARLPIDSVVRIWQRCVNLTKDPLFGLHFGQQVSPSTFHIVGYTLMNSATLREAFAKLADYQRLISDGGALQMIQAEQGFWLKYETRPNSIPFSDHQIDAVLAAIVTFSRFVTGQQISPLLVSFRKSPPCDIAEYQQHFQCTLSFDEEFDGLMLSETTLDYPLIDADTELCRVHEEYAQRRLQALDQQGFVWKDQVVDILTRRLADPSLNRAGVAQLLGISERTLQRKLSDEGLSFQEILDNVRRERGLGYVMETQISITEIAELLGYSDVSAFYRAFKRWTGQAPGEYRDRSI